MPNYRNWMKDRFKERNRKENMYLDAYRRAIGELGADQAYSNYGAMLQSFLSGSPGMAAAASENIARDYGKEATGMAKDLSLDLGGLRDKWQNEDEARAELETQLRDAKDKQVLGLFTRGLGLAAGIPLGFALGGEDMSGLEKLASGMSIGGGMGDIGSGLFMPQGGYDVSPMSGDRLSNLFQTIARLKERRRKKLNPDYQPSEISREDWEDQYGTGSGP